MLQSTGPCVQAEFHSGLGNWLYISVEVAIVALATNHSLVLPMIMHQTFRLPREIRHPDMTSHCRTVRNIQCASGDIKIRKMVQLVTGMSFAHARASMFQWMLSTPRFMPFVVGTAIHLRSVSDVTCHTYTNIRRCRHDCVKPKTLACVARTPVLPSPIVVLSDSQTLATRMRDYLRSVGYTNVHDESVVVNASDHSGLSSHSALNAFVLWTAFARARVRFASSISTFSKSALLAIHRDRDYVVETRCYRHRSDGALFTCRRATQESLV